MPDLQEHLDAIYDEDVRINGHDLAIQLILRAILLKLNSTQAHEYMRQQLHGQVNAVKNIWRTKELENVAAAEVMNECSSEMAEALRAKVNESFAQMAEQAIDVIDGVFEAPQDLMGTM
jgi:predicted Holliday junction resolvase-like endonuclease